MKKGFYAIRNLMMKSLQKRPMAVHELSSDTGINRVTVLRHLGYLESIGIVKRMVYPLKDRQERTLWALVKSAGGEG